MSVAGLTGNVALYDAVPADTKTNYYDYSTLLTMCCAQDDNACRLQQLNANLRIYTPPSDGAFPDGTVVLASCHLFASPHDGVILDAIDVCSYGGDPSDDNYDLAIPDDHRAFVCIVGTVIRKPLLIDDGVTLTFDLAVSQYIWRSKPHRCPSTKG